MAAAPITVLLEAARSGDAAATDALFSAVYGELKGLARSHRRRWRGNETLNTTVLIHEAYLKLVGSRAPGWENRTHFYATASQAMRQVLANYAEQQRATKRGGDAVRVPLEDDALITEATAEEVLTLHELLLRLETLHPRRCRIVECRIFGGMNVAETGEALGISAATVKREWQLASAWLRKEMPRDDAG